MTWLDRPERSDDKGTRPPSSREPSDAPELSLSDCWAAATNETLLAAMPECMMDLYRFIKAAERVKRLQQPRLPAPSTTFSPAQAEGRVADTAPNRTRVRAKRDTDPVQWLTLQVLILIEEISTNALHFLDQRALNQTITANSPRARAKRAIPNMVMAALAIASVIFQGTRLQTLVSAIMPCM